MDLLMCICKLGCCFLPTYTTNLIHFSLTVGMTKESKNSKQLPQIRVFIGRCWARKYNNTCKAVERRIHDKYTSKVVVSGGFKKCAKWRTVTLMIRTNV